MPVTLKDEIERRIQRDEKKPFGYWVGNDWWLVSQEEEYVFEIDLKRWAHMVAAYFYYDVFLGGPHVGEEEAPVQLLEAERAARPDLFDKGHCLAGFQQFAKEYASLPYREAAAVYAKMNFWHVRAGTTRYADEMEDDGEGLA